MGKRLNATIAAGIFLGTGGLIAKSNFEADRRADAGWGYKWINSIWDGAYMPIRNAIADNVGDGNSRTSGANVPLNRSQRRHGAEAGLISNGINYSAPKIIGQSAGSSGVVTR
jgi:hypothetical protein